MITTTFLGQIFGITFLIVSISVLIHPNQVINILERIKNDGSLSWVYGYLAVMTGAILLTFSNFKDGLSSFIAILGLLSFIKGVLFLWFPKRSANFNLKLLNNRKNAVKLTGICLLLISIILLITSF